MMKRERKPKQTKEDNYERLKQFIEETHNILFNGNTDDATNGCDNDKLNKTVKTD